jgi:TetR/AcrR family transcriptional repressor of nem operon
MTVISNREKILAAGLKVVLERGFGGAGIREIVQAAGVSQGSFTNNFVSKEAFGLEILNLYHGHSCATINETLLNDTIPALAGLSDYIDANRSELRGGQMRTGCLLGNYSAEVVDSSETIRLRLVEIFSEVQEAISSCLERAAANGEIPPFPDFNVVAEFVFSSLQGAILVSKAERSLTPIDRFTDVLFKSVLAGR